MFLQISMSVGGGPPNLTIIFIVIVFVIGFSLLFRVSRSSSIEVEYVSNEEIEAELLSGSSKSTDKLSN